MAIIFDGRHYAREREESLRAEVRPGLEVISFTFVQDPASVLYTRLKAQAAARIGITYTAIPCSLFDPTEEIIEKITQASDNPKIFGVMVQKPTKAIFHSVVGSGEYEAWWERLVTAIAPTKDIDCLTGVNLSTIMHATSRDEISIIPATVAACLAVLHEAREQLGESPDIWRKRRVAVIGRSAIVGAPLAKLLTLGGHAVSLYGRSEYAASSGPLDASIIISATGVAGLVHGDRISEGSICIDVGAPEAEFDRATVESRVAFLTPVPGGVGPVTVASLMESIVTLVKTSVLDGANP